MPDQPEIGRPDRLLEIVTGALECEPTARSLFLDRACGEDTELRTEAESLLRLDEPARDFIARPAIASHAAAFLEAEHAVPPAAMFQSGQTLGEFRIVSLLGEGGMGEVYLAEDTNLGRKVALKLIKTGVASRTLRRRFDEEKRILAGLNDPHIARLYGGAVTPEGLPYLVMEYVEGEALDTYCDKHRLSVEERLRLFRKVCLAVAYAHQHLVIHRDLKPANIRVTPEGEPKLLDFGIAKLLDSQGDQEAEHTVTRLGAMTPVYASPEQLRGESVTTATDIYSLAVVLYELLSGRRPFDPKKRRPGDLDHVTRQETAVRPSSAAAGVGVSVAETRATTPGRLARGLAGDLDNIVLMAMRPDPARRYGSVSQFSEDIQRHLDTQPVTARKETLRYVAAKVITRNKALAIATVLALLTLIGGIAATSWQAHVANEQRRRADRRFEDVRRLADSLMGEINDSVQPLAGSTATQQLIVARALEYLDNLGKEADSPVLILDLASAYEKIGNVQGNPYFANLGDTAGALASYRKAESLLRSPAVSSTTATTAGRLALGRIYRALGDVVESTGNFVEQVALYRQSLADFAQLARERGADAEVVDELARAYDVLGDGLNRTENGEAEQRQCFAQAMAYRQKLVAQAPASGKYRRSLAVAQLKLGQMTLQDKGHGIGEITRGVTGLQTLSEESPDNARVRRDYATGLATLGQAQADTGDVAGALSSRQKCLAIREQTAAADPQDKQAQFDLATAYSDVSEALASADQPEESLAQAGRSVALIERMLAAEPGSAKFIRACGLSDKRVGNAHAILAARSSSARPVRFAEWADAQTAYEKARACFSDLKARGIVRTEDGDMLEKLAVNIAGCERARRELGE